MRILILKVAYNLCGISYEECSMPYVAAFLNHYKNITDKISLNMHKNVLEELNAFLEENSHTNLLYGSRDKLDKYFDILGIDRSNY